MKTFFVSSTFRDMQFERDAIQGTVSATINDIAKQYADEVQFSDLRWGINTIGLNEEEEAKLVLDSCFDEIDRCRPYMIVILGYRYGWIPDKKLMGQTIAGCNLELEDLEKSVTALEIEYGALSHDAEQLKNTLFYFREINGEVPNGYCREDEIHEAKLKKLKERIQELTHGKAKTYTVSWDKNGNIKGISNFTNMLTEDLKMLLLPEWQTFSELTDMDKFISKQEVFFSKVASTYAPIESAVHGVIEKLHVSDIVTIFGGNGTGKTSLMSYLTYTLSRDYSERFVDEERFKIFPIFCGISKETSNLLDILKNLKLFFYYCSEDSFQIKNKKQSGDCYQSLFGEINWMLSVGGLLCDVVILVDSIENLPLNEQRIFARMLRDFGAEVDVKVVVSTEDKEIVRLLDGKNYDLPKILTFENKRELIRNSLNGRQIAGSVFDTLLNRTRTEEPMFLKYLVKRVQMLEKIDFDQVYQHGGGSHAIADKQIEIINKAPDNIQELLYEIIEISNRRVGGNLTDLALGYIASSLNGLKLSDLKELVEDTWYYVDLIKVINYCSEMFIVREDGRYLFSNIIFKKSVIDTMDELDIDMIHINLFKYFKQVKANELTNLQEYLYQCIQSDNYLEFLDVLDIYDIDANTVYQLILDYGVDWLADNIYRTELDDRQKELYKYLCEDFYECFNSSELEIDALLPIMKAIEKKMLNVYNPDNKEISIINGILSIIGDLYYHKGDIEKAGSYSSRVLNNTNGITNENDNDLRSILNRVASLMTDADLKRALDERKAFEMNQQALDMIEELYEKAGYLESMETEDIWEDLLRVKSRAYKNMSVAYEMRGNFDKAIEYELKDIEIAEKLFENNKSENYKRDLAYSNLSLGNLYLSKGYTDYVDLYFEKARKSYMELHDSFSKEIDKKQILNLDLTLDCFKKVENRYVFFIDEEYDKEDLLFFINEKRRMIDFITEEKTVSIQKKRVPEYCDEILLVVDALEKKDELTEEILMNKAQTLFLKLKYLNNNSKQDRDYLLEELDRIVTFLERFSTEMKLQKRFFELQIKIYEKYQELFRSKKMFKEVKEAKKKLKSIRTRLNEMYE